MQQPITLGKDPGDTGDRASSLVREAQARYDRIDAIPRSQLPDGPARDALLARVLAGQCYDAYQAGGEWYILTPPHDGLSCFPRTTPELWQYAVEHDVPLVYD